MPRLVGAVLLLAFWPSATAQQSHHTFWEVKGKHNTVYLLGSVHLLKREDSALPAEALQAYAVSKGLVMELDLSDLSADAPLDGGLELETLPEGQSLERVLGPHLYAELQAQAKPLGLDVDVLTHVQPWFAALLLQQLELTKVGFDPSAGIDMQFAQRAQLDHKPIVGLETLDDQLGIFAHMSMEQQRQYLQATLKESDDIGAETTEVVRAWQLGDTAKLEQLLREGSDESPELYRQLTTDRNRRWLPKIDQLLADDGDYLVVVGAMHLIGHDGLVDLLRQQGYAAVQH